ncbi:MAG: hypothetical protein WKF59_25245 [Chitinophagaceae bacterium]
MEVTRLLQVIWVAEPSVVQVHAEMFEAPGFSYPNNPDGGTWQHVTWQDHSGIQY